eukprot:scaffold20523_cov31-Tisochrysis_lutea.AAC.2
MPRGFNDSASGELPSEICRSAHLPFCMGYSVVGTRGNTTTKPAICHRADTLLLLHTIRVFAVCIVSGVMMREMEI